MDVDQDARTGGDPEGKDCPAVMPRRSFLVGLSIAASSLPRVAQAADVPKPGTATTSQATWPTLPAFSVHNFLDHFNGVALDPSKWVGITGHASPATADGIITVADSVVNFTCGPGQAAAMYYHVPLDKSKSQLWTWAVLRIAGTGPNLGGFLVTNPTPPMCSTLARWSSLARIIPTSFDVNAYLAKYDSAHAEQQWNGSASAWQPAGSVAAWGPMRDDDYYIFGLEVDGPNERWRQLGWCQTYPTAGTYTFNQGWRLLALTDWVSWSSVGTTDNLWLVLGNPIVNNRLAVEWRFEWVRYAEAVNNVLLDAWAAAKQNYGAVHRIRHYYSHDGLVFVPQDRTTWALDIGSSPPDDTELQEPCAVNDGARADYLFYTGTAGLTQSICVATARHVSPQNGPWTRGPQNPILQIGATGALDDVAVGFSFIIMDQTEPDPTKRWKMYYSGVSSADMKWRTFYATAPNPPHTSAWTKQGLVLDVGPAGSADSTSARDAVVLRFGGQWEVWYEGHDDNGVCHLMRATGSDLGSLTKDPASPYYSPAPNADSPVTVNVNGRTVTLGSTTGFVADAMVVFDQDPNQDSYSVSRVRRVLSSSQLELYHGLTGFTTSTPARAKQLDTSPNFTPRWIGQVGSEWWFYLTNWEPFLNSGDGEAYAALLEQTFLYKHSAAAPSGATPAIQYLVSPVIPRGFNDDAESVENVTLLNPPVPS